MKISTRISGFTLLLCMAGLLGFAAPQARADEEKDPPSRVARISIVDGSVSIQPGGEGDWGEAQRNRPMTIGDKIWVDKDARAELQAGAVTIHLGSMTALSFLNLDEGITQMRLAEGAVNFRVAEMRQGDVVELDAPNLAFTVKQAGDFRIDVNENGDATRVTVIRGEGEIASGGKTYPVHAEEQAEFVGTDNPEPKFSRAPGPDGLDNWAAQRDLREDNSASSKYVPRDMDGGSDLDENGTWNEEPEYGHVWYPNEVAPDWAPYSNGYWANVGPWGWTWVDYAPWGFAPFHYGRWAYVGGRWGWCPGPYFGGAVYGPAFVGWFGGGFGLGVGWFPLGFGEPFFPWFHCREGFINRINVRNTYIRNVNVFRGGANHFNYVNAHNIHGVTTTSRNGFMNGQPVNRGAMHLNEASLRGARVSNSVGVQPTRNSSFGAANHGNVARPSSTVQNRAVVARTSPAHGISGSQVHTMNNSRLTAGRPANANVGARGNVNNNSRAGNSGNSGRTWEAQGNATDRGRAPAGAGSSNSSRPNNQPAQAARNDGNRPPWARGNGNAGGAPNGGNNRSYTPQQRSNGGPQNYGNNNRSYTPPQRSGNQPNNGNSGNRGYSQPRTYSAPTRNYPAPQRSYTPPSRGSSGGGGSRGSSGGGSPHSGGGGSPHGGGGSHGKP